ncbi:MAG: hypothetical protein V4590_08420 [Bacteroidota bacterium]
MDTKQAEEQFKQLFTNWKQSLEEMRMQFSMGKMDAVEAFEKQKTQLRSLMESMKTNLDKATDVAEENATKLRSKLEELNLQLNLGKAEGKEMFEEQRKKIDMALQEVFAAGKLAYHGNYGYMMELFENNSKAIRTGLEIVQLQFALAKMEVKEESEKARKEIQEKIVELQSAAEKAQELTKENLEQWGKQMKEGMGKMQEWMSGWMKK